MYFTANFGPIEVGRITELDGQYFVTINAVENPAFKDAVKPETDFVKFFQDFYEAKIYATSFFPPRTRPFMQWLKYD